MRTGNLVEQALTKNKIISELTKSPHGDLAAFVPVGARAVAEDPEFFAHLIAWNERKGQVRDSKTALPVIQLAVTPSGVDAKEFVENAVAHLSARSPRDLVSGLSFARTLKVPARVTRDVAQGYLRAREARPSWWEKSALQHRASMKTLYALNHIKPGKAAQAILFDRDYTGRSVFGLVRLLPKMAAGEAADAIITSKIPFLVAMGAMGKRMKEPEVVRALVERMSPLELVTNSKMLDKLGLQSDPVLRALYFEKMQKVSKSTAGTFKTNRAAEHVTDERTKDQLRGAQEKQIKALGGIDGTWLILADKSGSMEVSIEVSRVVTATLAKVVTKGVYVSFFDVSPRTLLVEPGTPYENILEATRAIRAQGGTSIGCGLQRAMDNDVDVDGIAIVSDGAENSLPFFASVYGRYCEKMGKEPPVYFFQTQGTEVELEMGALDNSMQSTGHDMQKFDLRAGADMYALPNIVQTMRVNRYSLVDEIMGTPLLKLSDVLRLEAEAA
jgi:hypothetical protein